MVAAACARVAAADDGYRTAHEAAIDAGWSATALTRHGLPAGPHGRCEFPTTARRRIPLHLSTQTACGRPPLRYVEDSERRRRGRNRGDGCKLTAAGLR